MDIRTIGNNIIKTSTTCVLIVFHQTQNNGKANIQSHNLTKGRGISFITEMKQRISFEKLNYLIHSDLASKKYYDEFIDSREQRLKESLRTGEISILKYHRLRKNITQHQLAQALGIPQPHICRLEKRQSLENISLKKARKIAHILGISIEELLHV